MTAPTTTGRMTLAECADAARPYFMRIPETIECEGFPDIAYEIVDHGEFPKGAPEISSWHANPFRATVVRSALETDREPEPLGGRIDVWAVRHPATEAGDPYSWSEAEPEHVRWHAGGDSSASCKRDRDAAIESALGHLGFGVIFWVEKIRWARNGDRMTDRDARRVARIGGQHYVLGTRTSGEGRGMGGRAVKIRFTATGEEIVCTDLWHQGTIPAELRELLPDNAEMVATNLIPSDMADIGAALRGTQVSR